jgi:ATP-dependent exoDNAse (exonuclease V) beta subunit
MSKIVNQCILASAGTGKTFQLSDRIVKILLDPKVENSQIAALTFTRAAAAEFIIKVVSKLKDAASDKKSYEALCGKDRLHISTQEYTQKHFSKMLRKMLHNSNRITMGTLDSFFAKLVNNFPLEVGISTGIAQTISEEDARALSILVLQEVLQDREDETDVFNNLRDYNSGKDVTNPIESLVKMVKDYHGLFMMARDKAIWGKHERIFENEEPIWTGYAKKVNTKSDLDILESHLNEKFSDNKDGDRVKIPEKFEVLKKLSNSLNVSNSDVNLVVEGFEKILHTPKGQNSSYSHRKIFYVDAVVGDAIRNLILRAVDLLISSRLKQTSALFECLSKYEQIYDEKIRKSGLLGFSDYVTLITRADHLKREEIEFRLDCEIKHWLLDEFQDTSTLQYQVLERNIDEIISNANEDRSVFVVGDLKQSLYEWRSGNRKLLNNLNELISLNGESIPLNETYRCSPSVLSMVNAVLNKHNDERNLGEYYSPIAAQDWSRNFQEQKAVINKPGESIWVTLDKPKADPEDGNADEDEEETTTTQAQAKWIAEHLKKTPGILTKNINNTQRLVPGITCAVLVSRNKLASEITEVLRQEGIEATDEAKSAVITDNPVTAGLLGIIQATIHPDNGLARGTAEISPASIHIIKTYGDWEKTNKKVLEIFSEQGAEALINELVNLVLKITNNSFICKRLTQLRSLAISFDGKGQRNLEEFVHFLETNELRDTADRQTVQVITIHRSKGLEYDMVYMPCLNDSRHKIAQLRRGDLLFKQVSEDNFEPHWLLSNPGEEVCLLHAGLSKAVEKAKAENAYGSLCRLYVGMTRAKHRLVMISQTMKEDRLKFENHLGKHDFACLLESTLKDHPSPKAVTFTDTWNANQIWASPLNSDAWIKERLEEEKVRELKSQVSKKQAPVFKKFKPVTKIEKKRPSETKNYQSAKHNKSWKPTGDEVSGKLLGSAVHSLFEKHTTNTKEFLAEINKPSNTKNSRVQTIALELVNACLTSKEIVDLLDNRSADTIVWREQKAVLQHEGKMIDAVFDRVHIIPGKEATIIDYKTNRDYSDDKLESKYKGQMNIYRESISKLTGIPEDKITCVLINVRNKTLRKF